MIMPPSGAGHGVDNWAKMRLNKTVPKAVENVGMALEGTKHRGLIGSSAPVLADVTSVKKGSKGSYTLTIEKSDPYMTSAKFEQNVRDTLKFQSGQKGASFTYAVKVNKDKSITAVITPK